MIPTIRSPSSLSLLFNSMDEFHCRGVCVLQPHDTVTDLWLSGLAVATCLPGSKWASPAGIAGIMWQLITKVRQP